MNKIVALTLTASIALASLTGCAAKDAQQKETNVSGISFTRIKRRFDGAFKPSHIMQYMQFREKR